MQDTLRIVLDIGKTSAKVSVWNAEVRCVGLFSHQNQACRVGEYDALDVAGIEAWLGETLRNCAALGRVEAIIPVAHGAAAAILRAGALATPVMDYEWPIPAQFAAEYAAQRDGLETTGSPLMPYGLNLGAQFHYLERCKPGLINDDAIIVPWAQFWAWRLSGKAVGEVSSLGAHTDLWSPLDRTPSLMARRRGWASRLAAFASAGAKIGELSEEWQQRSGLSRDVAIHAGLHDSNAALHAARGRQRFGEGDATILSTGTWFVTMRAPAAGYELDMVALARSPACLVNVDIAGAPVPTALFMGGREFEELALRCDVAIDAPQVTNRLITAAQACIDKAIFALPCWSPGTGPFPDYAGTWLNQSEDRFEQVAASLLYLALMADMAFDLVGTQRLAVIDGRFANAPLFTRALASLRGDLEVCVANAENDVALGALRAIEPAIAVAGDLSRVEPLAFDLAAYRTEWRRLIAQAPYHRARPI